MLERLDLRGVADPASALPAAERAAEEPLAAVRAILEEVRTGGDDALRTLTERFDGVRPDRLRVEPAELDAALDSQPEPVAAALAAAAAAVRDFHRTQCRAPHASVRDGVRVETRPVPVARAGVYVPGGRGAYPSTVLMTAIPARVAGVDRVVLCVPPDRHTGEVAPVVLAAAALAGVDEVYAVGGAQAIAAMAYGTETIAPVDVIVGPGNRYVALAKREVAGIVGVPSAFAGPSEIVVVADATVPAAYAAIDVIVQAEHGPDGLAWLVTWDPAVLDAVDAAIEAYVARSPRAADITATFARGGRAVLVDGPEAAVAVANAVAPEHLELLCSGAEALVPAVRNAGAVFVGALAPASLGDYAAGPSHVLPTAGTARFGQALTVADFVKDVHVVSVDPAGFDALAPTVETLAAVEGFDAHAESVRVRRRDREAPA